jgi:TRAP-type uncharacterized transport system substrate-binding protein
MLLLYRRRWGLFYLPVLLLAILAITWAASELFPLPPRQLVMAAGVPQGGYERMAERYREELWRRGVSVDIVTSEAGAVGPLQRLANPRDAVQAGFAHGLLAERGPEAPVHALAVIGKQPVWIFTHQSGLVHLGLVRGLRVSAGPLGSPTRQVTAQLLAQAGVKDTEVVWVEQAATAAANDLLEQRVDVVVVIGSVEAPSVRLLTRSPGVHMMGIDRANGLARREPRLHPMVLPQGTLELRGDVPPRDLTLLYTETHLLVRETMHPALQRVLLDAATEIHAIPGFLQRQSEYPEFHTDFPLSPVARSFSLGSRPWLERVLPYWWAQLAELLLYGVLPVILLTIAALVWIPQLFSLRVNVLLAHFYGELKFIESEIGSIATDDPKRLKAVLGRLDQIELQVAGLDLPDRFADRWYTLREHLWTAQERLLKLRGR